MKTTNKKNYGHAGLEPDEINIEAALDRIEARERIEFSKRVLPRAIEKLWDSGLDYFKNEELPGGLKKAEESFIKDYEENTLQSQLEIIKEGLRRDFMENTLPGLLEDEEELFFADFKEFASHEIEEEEEMMKKDFETKTQKLLDKERARLCGKIKTRTFEHGEAISEHKDIEVSGTDIAQKNNQKSVTTMNFPIKERLTKKLFMGLPAGVYLASNTLNSNGTPIYAEYVAERGNPRILQWNILRAQKIRTCNVLAGKDDYEKYMNSNWLSESTGLNGKTS